MTELDLLLQSYRAVLDAIIALRPERESDLEAEESALRLAIAAALEREHNRAFGLDDGG
jgi:hypothetical protein